LNSYISFYFQFCISDLGFVSSFKLHISYFFQVSQFQIFSQNQIASLRKGGAILRGCLDHTATLVRPGITTAELDRAAEEFIRSKGGVPAFKGYHSFPATLCTSINEQCVHGLPGDRVLKEGDIVSLDCGVIYDDLYTDACVTVAVGTITEELKQFLTVTEQALKKAIKVVKKGARVGDISATIQAAVEGGGYSCVRALTGHGLGNTLHQFPDIHNVGEAGTGPVLPAHTLIAIEPITAMGEGRIKEEDDGWTISTADGSPSAHFEHTVLVTEGGCEVIA
jgi:methionyl aminopeptidase